MKQATLKSKLNRLYRKYNHAKYIECDPIKFVRDAKENNKEAVEITAFITAMLSFGRVRQIFIAVDDALSIAGTDLYLFILQLKKEDKPKFQHFQYRFVTGENLYSLFLSLQKIIKRHGTLFNYAKYHYTKQESIDDIVNAIQNDFPDTGYLVPKGKSSASKRIHMFLRWMVRKDNVDLGLWNFIPPSKLIIPLDTHIARVSKELHLTSRKTPSIQMAKEITDSLSTFCKKDPVRFDFALAHIGIIQTNGFQV